MSYDIYIGNAVIREEDLEVEYVVSSHTEPDAPVFPYDSMTANSNNCHPGYAQWTGFCREAGIHDLFFGEESGLMRNHPGIQRLHIWHLTAVQNALRRWREQHPEAVPGFDYSPHWNHPDDGVRGRDPILARLIWLEFWIDWALRTCEKPALYNF